MTRTAQTRLLEKTDCVDFPSGRANEVAAKSLFARSGYRV